VLQPGACPPSQFVANACYFKCKHHLAWAVPGALCMVTLHECPLLLI
jgi:hypothetical protein